MCVSFLRELPHPRQRTFLVAKIDPHDPHSPLRHCRRDSHDPVLSPWQPAFNAHPIQGWTPDFIPKVLEDGMKLETMDEFVPIPDGVAVATAQQLARTQGILTGISGGATMSGLPTLNPLKHAHVHCTHCGHHGGRRMHGVTFCLFAPPLCLYLSVPHH